MTQSKEQAEQTITVSFPIKIDDIRDLLVGAFEGGSNYWCQIKKANLAEGLSLKDFHQGGKMQLKDDSGNEKYYHWSQLVPFVEGCSLTLLDMEENKTHTLDLEAIKKGMKVFASLKPGKGGHHFNNFTQENYDAETSDVFLQCCLFGEIVYG